MSVEFLVIPWKIKNAGPRGAGVERYDRVGLERSSHADGVGDTEGIRATHLAPLRTDGVLILTSAALVEDIATRKEDLSVLLDLIANTEVDEILCDRDLLA